MRFLEISPVWSEILSELLINFAAAFFAVAFIETQISFTFTILDILSLTYRCIFGIVSLILAKYLREKGKN